MEIRNTILYPLLIVAAFSVTVFSMVGVATMTGHMPSAHSEVVDSSGRKPASPTTPGSAAKHSPSAAATCANCGVIESVRIVERKGQASGVGAVAGGLTGAVVGSQIGGGNGRTAMAVLGGVGGAYAGNEIEKNVNKRSAYQIKARMDDGSIRVSTQSEAPDYGVGEKVRYENGTFTRRS